VFVGYIKMENEIKAVVLKLINDIEEKQIELTMFISENKKIKSRL
jgi:hypothetical protein